MIACATAPPLAEGDAAIDVEDVHGRSGRVAMSGRVTIIDLCASWDTACNLNARVLDEVARALMGAPVDVVTILLDEGAMGRVALQSYATTLGVEHPALLAGPRVRSGASALGAVGYVPRVIVIDQRGRVRIDDSGGVVNVQFLVERIRGLLREQRAR